MTDDLWHAKAAANRIGVTIEEYLKQRGAGKKWCTKCKTWHSVSAFGADHTRGDGLAAHCLDARRVRQRALSLVQNPRRGWIVPTRDGDKLQARARVNYLVDRGVIPDPEDLPCMDCADKLFSKRHRHEYDHARGYSAENQLYVEPVCAKCHHNREDARRGEARA